METTVVGGGLAGLVASIEMAKRGARVTLFEKRRELGGRAASSREQGLTINFGPHALYRSGLTMQTLTAWGIAPNGGVPDISRAGYFIRDGRRYPIPLSLRGLIGSRLLTWAEKVEFAGAYRKLNGNPPESAAGLTVAQWLDRHTSRERVRQVLRALIRVSTYANDAGSLAMTAAMHQMRAAAHGVLYLDGGWQTMVDSLADLAGRAGVRIRTGETISRVTPNTILAIPPREVELLTGHALPPRKPLRMACLDLALTQPPAGAAHFALGLDQPYYFSMHSQWAARLAPGGASLVHVGRYLSVGEEGARAELERFCDIAMPGWRSLVSYSRFMPEMTVSHAMPEVNPRVPIAIPGLHSVFVAGDWVGSHGMLADTATASALEAARRLIAAPQRAAA